MNVEPQMIANDYNELCNLHSKGQNYMNKELYNRNVPSQLLQPYLSVRPVITKYSILPIVDARSKINVNMEQLQTYNPHKVFNPGNRTSPWSGYASNVNIESELRNQIYAKQSCSQAVYVPNSNSDLYKYSYTPKNQVINKHEDLFKKEQLTSFNPNPENLSNGLLFYNDTRQDIRVFTKKNNCIDYNKNR
jgi:flagellar basal body rod protein FlgC